MTPQPHDILSPDASMAPAALPDSGAAPVRDTRDSSAPMGLFRILFYSCLTLLLAMIVFLDSAAMQGWDIQGIKAWQALPTDFKDEISALLTVLGGPFCSVIAAAGFMLYFFRRGMKRQMLLFLSIFALLTGFEIVSKMNMEHVRPPEEYRRKIHVHRVWSRLPDVSIPTENSFPSGNAMRSGFFAFMLAVLLRPQRRSRQALIVAAGLTYVFWSAYTRVYLGVHWPSDVLGGAALGLMGGLAYVTASQTMRCDLRGSVSQGATGSSREELLASSNNN